MAKFVLRSAQHCHLTLVETEEKPETSSVGFTPTAHSYILTPTVTGLSASTSTLIDYLPHVAQVQAKMRSRAQTPTADEAQKWAMVHRIHESASL